MNAEQQRKALEWFKEWQIPCDRDQLVSLSRGPFRDVLNFLVDHARTDGYIETLRTNLYLQEGEGGGGRSGELMQSEINDAIFSEQEAEVKELESERERLEAEIERKRDILRERSAPRPRPASAIKKALCGVLDERVEQTKAVIAECDKIDATEREDKEEVTKKNVEALQQAAHEAFQGMVMRHFLLEGRPDTPLSEGGLTVEEFNELVMKVLEESDCGKCVSDWVRQERESFVKVCQDQAKLMEGPGGQSTGFKSSINEKMNKLVTSWSNAQVQANMKNDAREQMLAEMEDELKKKQQECKDNPDIGFRLSDFMSMIRLKLAAAKLERCKQHAAGTAVPIDGSRNIAATTNCFATPSPDKEIDTLFEFGSEAMIKDWVGAISDLEHIQELYFVLQKTWRSGKTNLSEMVRSAQRPKTELGPTLLQTIETMKLTVPKPAPVTTTTAANMDTTNQSFHSDLHSMLTQSMAASSSQGGSGGSPHDTTTTRSMSSSIISSISSGSESRLTMERDDLRDDVSVITERLSQVSTTTQALDEANFPGLSEARKFLDGFKNF